MKLITYNSPNNLTVGPNVPVRVNLSVGLEKLEAMERELEKINAVLSSSEPPDLLMDLSIIQSTTELWPIIRNKFLGPIGVVPHYSIFSDTYGLDANNLLERIQMLFENGVNFISIHCTPNAELFSFAKRNRYSPVTSRGGSLVIRDMLLNRRNDNIFSMIFDDICNLAKKYNAVINLGTTFRAASVAEGFDAVAKRELIEQAKYCKIAEKSGVQIVLEGPGHISLGDVDSYFNHIKYLNAPPMPLGPIVTDTDNELDHVAAAVGAATLMMKSKGGIINAITSAEHRSGVPNVSHLLDGLKIAKLSAQIASLTYNVQAMKKEKDIAKKRGLLESCCLDTKAKGCSRCGHTCPLIADKYMKTQHHSKTIAS